MQLSSARIVLTGATGGLGEALATALSAAGATLLLTRRNDAQLEKIAQLAGPGGPEMQADLITAAGVAAVARAAG